MSLRFLFFCSGNNLSRKREVKETPADPINKISTISQPSITFERRIYPRVPGFLGLFGRNPLLLQFIFTFHHSSLGLYLINHSLFQPKALLVLVLPLDNGFLGLNWCLVSSKNYSTSNPKEKNRVYGILFGWLRDRDRRL